MKLSHNIQRLIRPFVFFLFLSLSCLLTTSLLKANEPIFQQDGGSISFPAIPSCTYGDSVIVLNAQHIDGKLIKFKTESRIMTIEYNDELMVWEAFIKGAGDVAITAYCGDESSADYEEVTQTLSIQKAKLVVTASSQIRDYGKKNPIVNFKYTYVGFINPDDEALFTNLPIAYIDPAMGIDTPIGLYKGKVLVRGGTHPYYDMVYKNGSLEIRGQVGLVGDILDVTYGDPDFELVKELYGIVSLEFTTSNADIVDMYEAEQDGVKKWKATINSVGNVTLTYKAIDAGGNAFSGFVHIVVAKAQLKITAHNKIRLPERENPEFTYEVGDMAYNETPEEHLTAIELVTPATLYSPIGVYDIFIVGGESPNYAVTYVFGKLAIRETTFVGVKVNGEEHDINEVYDMKCMDTNEQYVEIILFEDLDVDDDFPNPAPIITVPGYTLDQNNGFRVPTEKPMIKEIPFSIDPNNGLEVEHYVLRIERRFQFDKTCVKRWDNTLAVLNNPALLYGYTISSYQWYRNDVALVNETNQYYSAGASENELLIPLCRYHVKLTMTTGEVLRTCDTLIEYSGTSAVVSGVSPNPVAAYETVTFRTDKDVETLQNATLSIYNISGGYVGQVAVKEKETQFNLPAAAGMYLVKFQTQDGFSETFKMIVK